MLEELSGYSVMFMNEKVLWLDIAALIFFFIAWFGYSSYADRHYNTRTNLMRTMDDMRKKWMQEMLQRENRMMDATLLGNLLRSIAFFASTTILILLGIVTVLGAHSEDGLQLVKAIPFAVGSTPFMWEVKLFLLAMILIGAIGMTAAIYSLRLMAPVRQRRAGAAAGLFGGALAGCAYSPFCPELGAAYMLAFYGAPIAALAAIGWATGPRLLRW